MITNVSQLPKLRKKFAKKEIVFLGGSFDLFHGGHLKYLKRCRQFGDILVVAISTDKRIKQRKGPLRPILSQKDRFALIDSVRFVDFTLISPERKRRVVEI